MRIMYLGPNLKGIVRRNQVFAFNPEKVIEEACKVNPIAKHLFVNMDNIVTHKEELRRPGSFLNIAYQTLNRR